MSDHSCRVIEIVGSSTISSDDAITNAVADAAKTLHHIGWFQVVETLGHVAYNKVAHLQVTLQIGFTLNAGDQA